MQQYNDSKSSFNPDRAAQAVSPYILLKAAFVVSLQLHLEREEYSLESSLDPGPLRAFLAPM